MSNSKHGDRRGWDLPPGWREVKLGDVCNFRGGFGFPIRYQGEKSGDYPFIKVSDMNLPKNSVYIREANNWITSDIKEEIRAIHCPRDSVVFAKVGEALKLNKRRILQRDTIIDNNMMGAIPVTSEIFPKFLYYYLVTKDFGTLCQVSAIPSVNQRILSALPLKLPPVDFQKNAVSILQTWDTAIEKTEALIVAKEKQLRWLILSLINRSGYKKTSISHFAKEIASRNRNDSVNRVLSVTNHSGFVLPENQFKKRVASDNLSNYKIVKSGQYAYNPARINVGSIARLDDWDVGVLSPMYVVFELDEGKINSDYFLHWLSSNEARQYIIKSAQGSVRKTVSFGDLGLIPIPFPHLEAQNEISHTLNTARGEITLLRRLVDCYRYQRCGLMQRLLTGKQEIAQ